MNPTALTRKVERFLLANTHADFRNLTWVRDNVFTCIVRERDAHLLEASGVAYDTRRVEHTRSGLLLQFRCDAASTVAPERDYLTMTWPVIQFHNGAPVERCAWRVTLPHNGGRRVLAEGVAPNRLKAYTQIEQAIAKEGAS